MRHANQMQRRINRCEEATESSSAAKHHSSHKTFLVTPLQLCSCAASFSNLMAELNLTFLWGARLNAIGNDEPDHSGVLTSL
jgi:hypothetical protein